MDVTSIKIAQINVPEKIEGDLFHTSGEANHSININDFNKCVLLFKNDTDKEQMVRVKYGNTSLAPNTKHVGSEKVFTLEPNSTYILQLDSGTFKRKQPNDEEGAIVSGIFIKTKCPFAAIEAF